MRYATRICLIAAVLAGLSIAAMPAAFGAHSGGDVPMRDASGALLAPGPIS